MQHAQMLPMKSQDRNHVSIRYPILSPAPDFRVVKTIQEQCQAILRKKIMCTTKQGQTQILGLPISKIKTSMWIYTIKDFTLHFRHCPKNNIR